MLTAASVTPINLANLCGTLRSTIMRCFMLVCVGSKIAGRYPHGPRRGVFKLIPKIFMLCPALYFFHIERYGFFTFDQLKVAFC